MASWHIGVLYAVYRKSGGTGRTKYGKVLLTILRNGPLYVLYRENKGTGTERCIQFGGKRVAGSPREGALYAFYRDLCGNMYDELYFFQRNYNLRW